MSWKFRIGLKKKTQNRIDLNWFFCLQINQQQTLCIAQTTNLDINNDESTSYKFKPFIDLLKKQIFRNYQWFLCANKHEHRNIFSICGNKILSNAQGSYTLTFKGQKKMVKLKPFSHNHLQKIHITIISLQYTFTILTLSMSSPLCAL